MLTLFRQPARCGLRWPAVITTHPSAMAQFNAPACSLTGVLTYCCFLHQRFLGHFYNPNIASQPAPLCLVRDKLARRYWGRSYRRFLPALIYCCCSLWSALLYRQQLRSAISAVLTVLSHTRHHCCLLFGGCQCGHVRFIADIFAIRRPHVSVSGAHPGLIHHHLALSQLPASSFDGGSRRSAGEFTAQRV